MDHLKEVPHPCFNSRVGLISSESFKDAGHASPTSVFEVPSAEDSSSISESSERISAELNELHMRVQLLKFPELESAAFNQISTLLTIRKDVAYQSSSAENWEVPYTLDVLMQSGFQDFGFDMVKMMWDYPDYPLDPTLFDDLEKKYGNETELRPERMLLFHRINLALSDIFLKHIDLRPWVMTQKLTGSATRARDAFENLISQESANRDMNEKVIQDMQWGDPIVLIVDEIEELLIDDIIITVLLIN